MHEHLLIDLARITRVRSDRLDESDLAVRELQEFTKLGGRTIVDVTNRNLGRSPEALSRIAAAANVNVIMGCGWYREPYYDEELWRLPVGRLADDIVLEIVEGIGEQKIKPGIIGEIGSDREFISPVEERSFRAAARAHLQTGLTISTHASQGRVGIDQLDLLTEEGVDPTRVVIGHCDHTSDSDYHETLAARGAWVQFDLIHHNNEWEINKSVRLVQAFLDRGYLHRLLLSQDVCKKGHLTAYRGVGYGFVISVFAQRLREAGLSEKELDTILVENPRAALIGS